MPGVRLTLQLGPGVSDLEDVLTLDLADVDQALDLAVESRIVYRYLLDAGTLLHLVLERTDTP